MTGGVLRAQVAKELTDFLRSRGLEDPWSDDKASSSRWLHTDDIDGQFYRPERIAFHHELVSDQRAEQTSVVRKGAAGVMLTAGPPGAGKSSAVNTDPRWTGYRRIDADALKDRLLVDASGSELIAGWTDHVLSDGNRITLRELSAYVHAESTVVARTMLERCLAEGENVIFEGTLASREHAEGILRLLDGYGYERLTVIDVEVPKHEAIERSMERWWQCRTAQIDPLGERFLPESAFDLYFPDEASESICAGNASYLTETAKAFGWHASLEIVQQQAAVAGVQGATALLPDE